MDSCRYDSFTRAVTPNIDRLGKVERRWTYASWTVPSHHAYMMGLTPHLSPKRVYASDVYKEDFIQWMGRLGVDELSFASFLPFLSLPKVLGELGYRCTARVSMPVLNSFTLLNQYFDSYKLMENHNDFAGMVDEIEFSSEQPEFYFLNLGETHYPYMLDGAKMPHISGVHGVMKGLSREDVVHSVTGVNNDNFFDSKEMGELHNQQSVCVEYIDKLIGTLYSKCPENTYFVVTADHGELFGEGGYFGHGPIMHEKCFEVPFLEGKLK
jgi:hypothetical protein